MKRVTLLFLFTLFAQYLVGQHAATKSNRVKPPKPINYSFSFRYYQVYADKNFDSTTLWSDAKLRKTFPNKGSIQHNSSKNSLTWKLTGEPDKETLHVFKVIDKDRLITIGGLLYFRYTDEKLGPSVAIFHPDKKIWVIYRQNPLPKSV